MFIIFVPLFRSSSTENEFLLYAYAYGDFTFHIHFETNTQFYLTSFN